MNKLSIKEHTKKMKNVAFWGHKMASEKWDTLSWLADIVGNFHCHVQLVFKLTWKL